MPRGQLNIRIADEQRQTWTEAAARSGLDLSSWIRQACDQAAACRHTRKRPGRSGLLQCQDCGKVQP